MLLLKRRLGESVQIGHDVTVTVLAISAGAVTIGIQAPPDWPIDRAAQAELEQVIFATPPDAVD